MYNNHIIQKKEINRSEIIIQRYYFVNKYLYQMLNNNKIASYIFKDPELALFNISSYQNKILNNTFKISSTIKYSFGNGFKGIVSLKQGDMISYCQYSSKENWKIAILNMANAHTPGGGLIYGAMSQEEQLCSRTNLYIALLMAKNIGLYPLKIGNSFTIDGVKIIKNSNFKDIGNIKDIVAISSASKHYFSEEQAKKDIFLDKYIVQNWLSIIYSASLSDVDELVISAIGSGALHNPTENVATQLFNSLLYCNPGNIKKITIVIYDDHNNQRKGENFKLFSNTFNQECLRNSTPFSFISS